jgi:hypothetical protein
MDELVHNVLIEWFGTESNLDWKLKLVVKWNAAQIDNPMMPEMCAR